ncbi:MAG: lyase family protein, partial [Rhodococcus sp. (in: high G+C Gram-positive bacteria)]
MADTRIEKDLLGEREIPSSVYWGIHTLRALENFPITGRPISTNAHLGRGLAAVKWAAASANQDLGILDANRGEAIRTACQEILDGQWHE